MILSHSWAKLARSASPFALKHAIKPLNPLSSRTGVRPVHAANGSYPSAAVGIVVLRRCPTSSAPQVLLIHRGKPPATGGLCFPGGRVELGESLSVAAAREVKEETGIDVVCRNPPAPLQVSRPDPDSVPHPRPVTTIDGIYYADDGKLAYHYAIVEAASVLTMNGFAAALYRTSASVHKHEKQHSTEGGKAVYLPMIAIAADPLQEPTASDDAETATWMDVHRVQASECVPSVVDVLKLAMQTISPKALDSSV